MEKKHGFANPVFVPNECENEGAENTGKPEVEALDFDDFLPHIGEFGIYQKILFLLILPFSVCLNWVYYSQIFIVIVPEDHWCWVSELSNSTVEERYVVDIFLMDFTKRYYCRLQCQKTTVHRFFSPAFKLNILDALLS